MAVTTDYEFIFVQNLDLQSTSRVMDITGMSDGGLSGLGNRAGHIEATYFDGGLTAVGDTGDITGQNGALDQLANGNVVIATEAGATLSYRIETAAGGLLLGDTAAGDTNMTEVDVAALAGGGFVIATQHDFGAGDNDIEIQRYTAAGVFIDSLAVDGTLANDQGPAITGLVDGGFAVAWARDLGGGVTEGWHAVYNADGSVRRAAEAQDANGFVNTGMSIVGLDNGGYAIAYQDDGLGDGDLEIGVVRFDAAGAYQGDTRVTTGLGDDTEAAIALLSNGMIAVTWSNAFLGDNDVIMQLLDPDTGAPLLNSTVGIAGSGAEEFDSAAADWGLAGVAVSVQGNTADVEAYQLKRTSTGDGAANTIVGDDAVDEMEGGGGGDSLSGMANDDTLRGEAGSDTLIGGDGGDDLDGGDSADVLLGGAGADTLDGRSGVDSLNGAGGDDYVSGGFGQDTMVGGPGRDILDFANLPGATVLDLGFSGLQNTGSGGGDTLIGFEDILTGAGDDRIFGSGQPNFISTGEGADTVKAADGADVIYGGGGSDKLTGGAGDDEIHGEGGRDLMRGGFGADSFTFSAATDSAVGVGLCDVIRDFDTSQGDFIRLDGMIPGVLDFIGADAFSGSEPEVRVGVVAQGQLVQVDADGDGASDMDILVLNSGLSGGENDFIL